MWNQNRTGQKDVMNVEPFGGQGDGRGTSLSSLHPLGWIIEALLSWAPGPSSQSDDPTNTASILKVYNQLLIKIGHKSKRQF